MYILSFISKILGNCYLFSAGTNHARKLVATRENIAEFNGIMILSGDGLVYEVGENTVMLKPVLFLENYVPMLKLLVSREMIEKLAIF